MGQVRVLHVPSARQIHRHLDEGSSITVVSGFLVQSPVLLPLWLRGSVRDMSHYVKWLPEICHIMRHNSLILWIVESPYYCDLPFMIRIVILYKYTCNGKAQVCQFSHTDLNMWIYLAYVTNTLTDLDPYV
jgi:hypothetical protein